MIEFTRPIYASINDQPVYYMLGLMNEMKHRGVPVKGAIAIVGVSAGHLEMFHHGDKAVYRYYKDGEARQPLPAPVAEEDDGEL